jgi:predicted nucleic acid-binding Zn ribbon protein
MMRSAVSGDVPRLSVVADESPPPSPTGSAGPEGTAGPNGVAGPDLVRAALASARLASRRQAAEQPRRRVAGRRGAGGARGGGYSGAGPDARDPQPFGVLVRGLLADRGWEATAASATVLARWETLVGAEVAQHCQPVSLRDGELTLAAESTAWATQLRLLAPRLLGRIRAELGAGVVSRVRVHGPTAPTWGGGARRVAGRGPRDTYG